MISLRKPICLRKPPRPQPSAIPAANYAGLSLAKGPRPSHPEIICVIHLLARQAARHAFALDSATMNDHFSEGTLS